MVMVFLQVRLMSPNKILGYFSKNLQENNLTELLERRRLLRHIWHATVFFQIGPCLRLCLIAEKEREFWMNYSTMTLIII